MTKPWESKIPSESESENAIGFIPTDFPCSIQSSYLQSKRDHLKSETPVQSNSCNQNHLQKNNRPNVQ